jgi:photosystem II stability/assembly factor-like uncharacterized protein
MLFTVCLLRAGAVAATDLPAPWTTIGPDGGDVRSLAFDPRNPDRVFLGTSAGQIYLSTDGGESWSHFAHLGEGDDYVLDDIAVDPESPETIYAAAWSVVRNFGDIFRSRDGGRTWETLPDMHGKSVRSFAIAPSRPSVLIAGALDGVYRSDDGGDHWSRISPADHAEIKNVESLAIDPRAPDIIYIGTWHLPWKTYDGGHTWKPIHKGIIDDSDVFSIIVDEADPMVVYLSACSGIYKSKIAGHEFEELHQGIPSSARRTRVLRQDPSNSAVVYAGTTEGLWKTTDSGATWNRITASNLIVNDLLVDPRQPSHLLIATDRAGVLASNDGGLTTFASSRGFAHRQVAALLVDRSDPNVFYAGLVNDKEFGGLYLTRNGGAEWEQMSDGLDGRDVFSLLQASNGDLVAGTNDGIFRYAWANSRWEPANLVLTAKLVNLTSRSTEVAVAKRQWVKSQLAARISDMASTPARWFAATSDGLYRSLDEGASWSGGEILGHRNFVTVDVLDDTVLAASPSAALLSGDGGSTWRDCKLPIYALGISEVAVSPDALWIVARDGAFFSKDSCATWEHTIVGPPAQNLVHVTYDPNRREMLGVADDTGDIYESAQGTKWTRRAKPGWQVRRVMLSGERILALTPFNGVVAVPSRPAQADVMAGSPAPSP